MVHQEVNTVFLGSNGIRPVFGDAIWKIQGDIKTGREVYRERIPNARAFWASPWACDGTGAHLPTSDLR